MQLPLVGGVIGVVGAVAVGRLLQSFLYGVAPLDVASLGGALGVLVMPAATAAFLPIWRRRALIR